MKLLLVEDELKILNSLKKGFEEEEFVVDTSHDGADGLEKAIHGEYDAVVLDIMLPRVNGMTILRKMREKKVFTPVLLLTAKDAIEDKVEGLNLGADDYLAKPFSFDELLARVNALIRRANHGSTVLAIDTLELDPQAYRVTRKGEVLPISKREFKILEYLMMHKGSILSEQRIINQVWEYDTDVSSNVVAAHIKNLRNKIDKKFPREKQLLITVRGIGYKIDG